MPNDAAETRPATAAPPQRVLAACAALAIAALALWIGARDAPRYAVNFLMGCLLGYALYRTRFGFTGPWRRFIAERRGVGLRRTLLMLAVASTLTMTFAAVWGYPTRVHPVGPSLLVGAFLFGIGMQLGGGCGSGTAWVAGGGSGRVSVTLFFFIAGSVWGSLDAPWWGGDPKFGRFALAEAVGAPAAILITLSALAALAALSALLERARHGALEGAAPPASPPTRPPARALYGPWPPWAGAAAIGALAALVVVVTLQPWGVTFGYTLYGVKTLAFFGFDATGWTGLLAERPFWSARWAQAALRGSLWRNNAANMTVGLMMGAALAAALVGAWRPSLKGAHPRALLAAALGGLMMGYGARISTGCNIGALVNGVAAGSAHGWAWMAAAFLGGSLGVRALPAFRLRP